MAFAPVLTVSALTGWQLERILPTALRVVRAMRRGLPHTTLLTLLKQCWVKRPPPRMRGRPLQLVAAKWRLGFPPCIELTTRPVGVLPLPYQRFLMNQLHQHPALAGIPVRLATASKQGNVVGRKRRVKEDAAARA